MHRNAYAATTRALLRQFPAVALVGPRQSGKTTLAKSLRGIYFDLEQDEDRVRLDAMWPELVAQKQLVVLDEVQTWPDVFRRLRGAIDVSRKRNGRFLLLGSASPFLMREVGESLAGRLGILELTPFLVDELGEAEKNRLWAFGGFPDGGVLKPKQFGTWQKNYLQLMAQRDLPTLGLSANSQTTQKLFHMIAAVHGGMWNASEIGRSLGISYHTAQAYTDLLEGAFLIRLLAPYAANLKKRLVKTPKVYWRDSGLLHVLRGLTVPRTLLSQPWVGSSFEGYVIEQIVGAYTRRGMAVEASFYRSHLGDELDLVLRVDGKMQAFEIKLSSSPSPQDVEKAKRIAATIGAQRLNVICRTSKPVRSNSLWITTLEEYLASI